MQPTQSIQRRLVFYVSLGLLAFAALSGVLVYRLAFTHELDDAASFERQLVSTIQAQAEVAVFAQNAKIAEEVIEGLRTNPRIRAVRISSQGFPPFNIAAGFTTGDMQGPHTNYPLLSPVTGSDTIGMLTVVRNDALIQAEATLTALRQVFWVLMQMAATALLIILFFRHQIGQPLARLASSLAAIQPGSRARIEIDPRDSFNEIGSLSRSANTLIETAELALAKVHALAVTDELTGLANRRAFMTRLGEELARVQRYATSPTSVLMLDLDHFKQINDRHGHAAGDTVLRRFSAILNEQLRKVDAAGRLGGEEFAVLLPDTDAQAAAIFAERLRQTVAGTPTEHDGSFISCTLSIGISCLTRTDEHPEDALARADRALYDAKQNGRNRVAVYAEPHSAA